MAKPRDVGNAGPDLIGNLEQDLNDFVRAAILELSSEDDPVSPIDTGFFASSWTASTQRPRPDQSRLDFAPWSNIEPTYEGRTSPNAVVFPRFLDKMKFNFKIYSKVYIGNRSQYAASALGSKRSKIPQFIQGELRPLVNAIFTEKRPKIDIASRRFKGGQGGIGPFADPEREFVDYTNL